MFALKKIISSFIIMPGILIMLLILSVIFRNKIKTWKLNVILIFFIYLVSIFPVANFFIGKIEKHSIYTGTPAADVIILLGGGYIQGVTDITGRNIPSPDMLVRIVEAVRLYNRYKLPIIFTGGPFEPGGGESLTVKRFLTDLGVNPNHIILEDKSIDTVENAAFVKAILGGSFHKKAVLITSAFHMKRSELIFKRYGFDMALHSAGGCHENREHLNFMDFLPDPHELGISSLALRELIGYNFYRFKFKVLKL